MCNMFIRFIRIVIYVNIDRKVIKVVLNDFYFIIFEGIICDL